MQHGFTSDVVALAQLQGASEPLGLDCKYRPHDTLQTIFKNQTFRHYHVSKHLPQSPASTVSESDHSDHSDSSTVSENSSQSEYSELEDSPSASDHPSKQHRHAIGPPHGDRPRFQPATSSFTAETQPRHLVEVGHNQHVSSFVEPLVTDNRNSNSNNSVNNVGRRSDCRPADSHYLCHYPAPNTKDAYLRNQQNLTPTLKDCSGHEASQLAYRSRPENPFEVSKTTSCNGSQSVADLASTLQSSTSVKVDSPHTDKLTQARSSRCYSSLLNPFTGFKSSRNTPTESPQHVQSNARRRPVNPALAPPKLRRDTDNTDAIVRMIVIFCTNLIQSIWPVDSNSTPSTCQSRGNVLPLQVFITETLRRSKTSYSTLQIALFYLILLKQCLPELANPGQSGQSGCRAMLCGRRMFLTALILASKYLQDRNYSARAWSKISGLPMKEINDNERRYLRFVGWDLHVPKDAFENWSKIVLAICRLSTGQDFNGQDPHQPPPSPPAPCMAAISNASRKGQLQDMCPESQMYAVRAWWVFNLQALRTDVVRCPKKTEQYVLSIPQLKGAPTLTRPLFENKGAEDVQRDTPEQEILPSIHKLARPSSMEFIDRVQPQASNGQSMGTSKIMPPPPPMPGTLPTPQTTPRSDMASTWGTSPSRSRLRCHDSASFLRGLDRPCSLANIEKFAMPRSSSRPPTSLPTGAKSQDCNSVLSQPSPGAWLPPPLRARDYFQTPDTSLTSSPESIVSDLSSMSGFAGRSRTSSFSSTSSRSTMSLLNTMASDPERCEGFKRQLNSIDAQIAPRVHDWRTTSMVKESGSYVPQSISRPQTAFRNSKLRPGCVEDGKLNNTDSDSDSVTDEGYWSSDYSIQKREERKRQNAAQALVNMQLRVNADSTPTALKHGQILSTRLNRPALARSNTQVYVPVNSSVTTQNTLKRSRSESFDHSAEPPLSDLGACNASHAQARNIQQSCQPWADSKQPVFCGTQDTNKRIAVQSAAATRASTDLRRQARSWFDLPQTNSETSKISRANDDDLMETFSWQSSACVPNLQEIHL